MPSRRYWELEDASADWAQIQTAPDDIARLLLVEFALVYGDDWLLAPLDIPVGQVARVTSLVVTDTFGRETVVRAASDLDGDDRAWRMFVAATPDGRGANLLFATPSAADVMQGPAVEDVRFAHDELANLAWGIERTVESALGERIDRGAEVPPPPEATGTLAYRLRVDPRPNWLPLRESVAGFVVARLPGAATPRPVGTLLRFDALPTDELPREGLQVTRHPRRARWIDGRTHVWVAHAKNPGRIEGASGLQFDILLK